MIEFFIVFPEKSFSPSIKVKKVHCETNIKGKFITSKGARKSRFFVILDCEIILRKRKIIIMKKSIKILTPNGVRKVLI